ncbi:putative leucine-rich repeat-containing protein DDB_G0290503 [Narcine bancroftii]|uniref:putative leucine-rich repeat-containing protein DDB_G0290503 n=1 Tax=Narcine bancroftii TaxID=1343680 RepID=UPI00383229D8
MRQKHELRQQWKAQENNVQIYGTTQRNYTPLGPKWQSTLECRGHHCGLRAVQRTKEKYDIGALPGQLLKTSMVQAGVSEGHQENEKLQAAVEEFQCINNQFSPTNVDVVVQPYDFKPKHSNLQERNTKMQSTFGNLTIDNDKDWSQGSKVQESIINLKTAVEEVKENGNKLQSTISKLQLKHEQINSINIELQSNIQPMEASVENKKSKEAGAEEQELVQVLKLHEQNNLMKTMIVHLYEKQNCQKTLNLEIQDSISQIQDVMEKLQQGNKLMQTIISELEKKYQFEDFASAVQRNIVKLREFIPNSLQLCEFSQLKNMKETNLNLHLENQELQAKVYELCQRKHWLETSLSTLEAKVFQLEASKSENQTLQYKILNLQNKNNENANTIIKLEAENVNLQKIVSDLQNDNKQLFTIISELQSKSLKLEDVELENKQLRFLVTDLLRTNAELNTNINELAEKNNILEKYILQGKQNVYHQITNVKLQGYTRPQNRITEGRETKYQFEALSSELQAALHLLEITDTMKEKLQVLISEQQKYVLEVQDNILRLHRRIKFLHQLVIELQNNSHLLSQNVLELQDKIYRSSIFQTQNQFSSTIYQGKKCYNGKRISIPVHEAMLELPFTTSTESFLIHLILKVIKVSEDIEESVENIGVETKQLQTSFFDLDGKIIEMQLHNDGLLNSEEGTLQEIVQQLKEHKHTLEKLKDEKSLLIQKIFDLGERLAEEKYFSCKLEIQIRNQQQAADSKIKMLQKSLKEHLSNNMKLEKTINWSLERNGVLDVKLAILKNTLTEEQVQFSKKEAKLHNQWMIRINQIEHLQDIIPEIITENTDLKESVRILDREKAHLQATVFELQSKLKSEMLHFKI